MPFLRECSLRQETRVLLYKRAEILYNQAVYDVREQEIYGDLT